MKIGILDSGIGGLSVLYTAVKAMPDANFIYYADRDNVPYGTRNPSEVRGFTENIMRYLMDQGADAVVIACNTATSVVPKSYRETLPVPVIGMEPAVKKAVEDRSGSGKRILVAATPMTIAGSKLHDLVEAVDCGHLVDLVALPGLVSLAENMEFESPEAFSCINEALAGYNKDIYDTLVLGCTHFNYFKEVFNGVFGRPLNFVDGNEGTVRQLMRRLGAGCEYSEKKVDVPGRAGDNTVYCFSGRECTDEEKEQIGKCLKLLDRVYNI